MGSFLGSDQSFRRILLSSMPLVIVSDSRVALGRLIFLISLLISSLSIARSPSNTPGYMMAFRIDSSAIQLAVNLSRVSTSLDAMFNHRRARFVPCNNLLSRADSCLLPSWSCMSPDSLAPMNSERKNLMRSSESSRLVTDSNLAVGIFLIHPFTCDDSRMTIQGCKETGVRVVSALKAMGSPPYRVSKWLIPVLRARLMMPTINSALSLAASSA